MCIYSAVLDSLGHPIQIETDISSHPNVISVYKILWYLNDTIQYGRDGKGCNAPALKIISAAIQTELNEWLNKVSWS